MQELKLLASEAYFGDLKQYLISTIWENFHVTGILCKSHNKVGSQDTEIVGNFVFNLDTLCKAEKVRTSK